MTSGGGCVSPEIIIELKTEKELPLIINLTAQFNILKLFHVRAHRVAHTHTLK